eukprot:4957468-Prymnesium_polylepis.1
MVNLYNEAARESRVAGRTSEIRRRVEKMLERRGWREKTSGEGQGRVGKEGGRDIQAAAQEMKGMRDSMGVRYWDAGRSDLTCSRRRKVGTAGCADRCEAIDRK